MPQIVIQREEKGGGQRMCKVDLIYYARDQKMTDVNIVGSPSVRLTNINLILNMPPPPKLSFCGGKPK